MIKPILALSCCALAPAFAADYYVAPDGSDAAAGTLAAPWRSAMHAQERVRAGDSVYFRGGRYVFTAGVNACASRTATVNAVTLDKSGEDGKPIRYWAYPGETPVFDFAAMKDDCRVKGFNVTASWVHLRGLEITGVPQQPQNRLNHESWGVWISGSHNVFEQLDLHHNMGPGLFIKDGATTWCSTATRTTTTIPTPPTAPARAPTASARMSRRASRAMCSGAAAPGPIRTTASI